MSEAELNAAPRSWRKESWKLMRTESFERVSAVFRKQEEARIESRRRSEETRKFLRGKE